MKLAIIGTGIAGLGCARFLHRDFDLTVYEGAHYLGGHSNTLEVSESQQRLPIDTGFMVFNRVTYPLLCRLFEALQVPVKPTDMSFSVKDQESGLEWNGHSLNHLFAQRRNLIRPRFWKLLFAITRFNQEALKALADPTTREMSLAHYVERGDYGDDFLKWYLIPMSSAVWSTPPDQMLHFPADTLLRFFHNHGFLGMDSHHPWWTVQGGAREYVKRLVAPFHDKIRLNCAATKITRNTRGVSVEDSKGEARLYDRVILATHADQALNLLADPSAEEKRTLGHFRYQANPTLLHSDPAVMPVARLAWASWNYRLETKAEKVQASTHYWMNRLQGVSKNREYLVSLNAEHLVDNSQIHHRIHYTHPLFDQAAVRAQALLPQLNLDALSGSGTFFAGSFHRYGFHEDGLYSAYELSRLLLAADPWSKF